VIQRFGKFESIEGPGPHVRLPWPIDSTTLINIERIESYTDQTRMLTSDENMVDINVEVQYRRADPKAYAFNVKDPEATLREISESAIRETIGRSKLEDVLEAGRQKIASDTRDLIQSTLVFYKTGIEVTSLNLQDVKVPEQVAPAQQDAIKAGKDKERFGLEAQTYANDILPKARGATARQVQDAQAYRARKIADSEGETARFTKLLSEYERAPAVTRQRLLDAKGSGNMLYLPLDKLMEQRSGASETPRDTVSVTRSTTPIGTVEVTPDDRRSRGTR
jgi:membrane protease subunit HflK